MEPGRELRRCADTVRLLLSSPRAHGGLSIDQVACEYRHQTGEDPPHRNLGLPSLTALLRSLPPNVCRLEQTPGGGVMVYKGGRGGWQEGAAGTRVQDSQAGDRGRKAWPGCLPVLLGRPE